MFWLSGSQMAGLLPRDIYGPSQDSMRPSIEEPYGGAFVKATV